MLIMPEDNKQILSPEILPTNKPGRKPINKEQHKARVKRACGLYYQGFGYDMILTQINSEAIGSGWGVIKMSQLRKDVSNKFNYHKNFTLREYEEHLEGDKQAFIARIEKEIETLRMDVTKARLIRRPKKNDNGDLVQPTKIELTGLYSLSQILMAEKVILEKTILLAQIKGYTMSVNVNNIKQNTYNQTNVAIYERADDARLELANDTRQGITDMLEALSPESEDPAGRTVLDGVVDESAEVEVSKS